MDPAIIGFLGVVAGVLTTGGVQSFIQWRGRSNDSLAAARLVYGSLVEAQNMLVAYENVGRFPPHDSFERQLAVWEEQKERLARVLDVLDFQRIQAAFSNLRYMEDIVRNAKRENRPDGGMGAILADPSYHVRIKSLSDADLIALDAGRGFRDRRKEPKHLQQLANAQPDGAEPPPHV
jgi:hypothetical protein